jgi:FkbM family methyltransferase
MFEFIMGLFKKSRVILPDMIAEKNNAPLPFTMLSQLHLHWHVRDIDQISKNLIWNGGQLVTTNLPFAAEIKNSILNESLLDNAKTQWQLGDWDSLVKLQRDSLKHHPERAKLALLAAAGHQQLDDMNAAREFVQLARDWGCDKQLISRVLVAGVYNTLGKAAVIGGEQDKALALFEQSVKVGMPSGGGRVLINARINEQLAQLGFPEKKKINAIKTAQILNNCGLSPISSQVHIREELKQLGLSDYNVASTLCVNGVGLKTETPIRVIEDNGLTRTFVTEFGKVTLYANETFITPVFDDGLYWDIDNLRTVSKYIDPRRNILEIGGHCGTSSLVYASLLSEGSVIFVFEPQQHLFDLLLHNVRQNRLEGKIIPVQSAMFCCDGELCMNDIDIDGGFGNPEKRYTSESNMPCNFGGIGLGGKGEKVRVTSVDSVPFLSNIGFMHVDAQGAEPFIFAKSTRTLRAYRPVILFEDNMHGDPKLYNHVKSSFTQYEEFCGFDVERYCVEVLDYHTVMPIGSSIDVLLLP